MNHAKTTTEKGCRPHLRAWLLGVALAATAAGVGRASPRPGDVAGVPTSSASAAAALPPALPSLAPSSAPSATTEPPAVPAAPAVTMVAAAPTAPALAPAPAATDWPFVGGLVAVSGGALFLFVGQYALFRLNDAVRQDEMKSYRATVPAGESACEKARAGFDAGTGAASPEDVAALCDEAERLEIVRDVALPVGFLATAVGLWLVGTSDTVNGAEPAARRAARRWRGQLGVGPDGAGASVSLAW
jgi:hypothetical protein